MIFPTYDIVVYATSVEAAKDEARQYGYVTPADLERMTVVTPKDEDLSVALALPVDTPWINIANSIRWVVVLTNRFGPATTVPKAFGVQNDEYAINPKRFRLKGTPG